MSERLNPAEVKFKKALIGTGAFLVLSEAFFLVLYFVNLFNVYTTYTDKSQRINWSNNASDGCCGDFTDGMPGNE